MEFILGHKKLVVLSIVPFILSVFNCYIYLKDASIITGLVPLSWRITITALVLYVSVIWPVLKDYDDLFDKNKKYFHTGNTCVSILLCHYHNGSFSNDTYFSGSYACRRSNICIN